MHITVRLWAGAQAAAGQSQVACRAQTLAELRADLLAQVPALTAVLPLSTLLLDGQRLSDTGADDQIRLRDGQTVEVLPPFAGG